MEPGFNNGSKMVTFIRILFVPLIFYDFIIFEILSLVSLI